MSSSMIALCVGILSLATGPAVNAQEKKWEPFQFKGNERYEYKLVTTEESEKREVVFGLDVRKKGEEDLEVTWSVKSPVKKSEFQEKLFTLWAAEFAGMLAALNPIYLGFIKEVELKEGEKLSLLGAGTVKVTKKQTVGGRTGLGVQWYSKKETQETLDAEWVVDPELALPIRCITYQDAKERYRMELLSYKKD